MAGGPTDPSRQLRAIAEDNFRRNRIAWAKAHDEAAEQTGRGLIGLGEAHATCVRHKIAWHRAEAERYRQQGRNKVVAEGPRADYVAQAHEQYWTRFPNGGKS